MGRSGRMVRDGARAPPHHEGLASLPPLLSDIDGGGIFGAGAAWHRIGADGAGAAAKTRKAGRILRHHARLDRGQCKAAALVRHSRSRPGAIWFAGISQRADPDLALSRFWRLVGTPLR